MLNKQDWIEKLEFTSCTTKALFNLTEAIDFVRNDCSVYPFDSLKIYQDEDVMIVTATEIYNEYGDSSEIEETVLKTFGE